MARLKPLVLLAVPALVASGSATHADVPNSTPPSFAPPSLPTSTITGIVALPPAKTVRPIFRPIATTLAPKVTTATTPTATPQSAQAPLVTAPLAPAAKPTAAPILANGGSTGSTATTADADSASATATTKLSSVTIGTPLPGKQHGSASTPAGLKPAPTVLAKLPEKTVGTPIGNYRMESSGATKQMRVPMTSNVPSAVPPIATAPTLATPNAPALPAMRTPSRLASREAAANQLLLARLDAQLAGAQRRLNRAEVRLSEGQRQLGAFTNVLQAAMLQAGPDARGLHPFVRVAQRYLGTPYVWGGESARGFDCSGFIMRVMRDLGYRALPHSAAEQFRYGLPIAKPLLKPGDVVFFANTYKPGVSHVGIYLGGNRFIHAANSKVGTIVSSINDPKWVAHYAGARRLIPARS